jgi:hypothetical protein
MSNPSTYFLVEGTDLSSIFQPLSLGTSYGTNTGYKVGNQDFNDIFAKYTGSGTKANATGYNFNGNDLCDIFAKYQPFSINVSKMANLSVTTTYQNGYNIYTFETVSQVNLNIWNPGTCTITFSTNATISVILVGGGGAGGWGSNQYSGGGGGGGNFSLTTANVTTGTDYSLQVGSGGSKYINGYQHGQSSSLQGGSITLSVNGGNQGQNATKSSYGTGGTSSNGGSGGNGGNPGSDGSDGTNHNYTTDYGGTLEIGGGGGGGSVGNKSAKSGGYGGNNGTGGIAGITNVKPNRNGSGAGAGGGGGPGSNPYGGSSTTSGGYGHSGIVIIYINT